MNPDFGQADVDRQVVNLTRFSVFFPERRPFFLENRGVFFTGNGQRLEPFFSRRIGLDGSGEPIPIIAGGRYSVRAPGGAFGALFAAQREGDDGTPASRFGVLGTSPTSAPRIGWAPSSRLAPMPTVCTNVVAGPDWFWRPSSSSFVRGTLTGSTTSGDGGEGLGGYIWVANEARWGYVGYISEVVTRAYEARSGFILRNDYVRISPAATLDWRPAWRPSWVRRFQPGFTLEHYVGASDGRVQEGFLAIRPMTVQFQNGGSLMYIAQPSWQRLQSTFRPVPGVSVPAGDYDYMRHQVTLQSDPSARFAARLETGTGGYFDGSLSALRLAVQATPDPRAAFSVDYTLNRLSDVGGATGTLSTHLVAAEARLAANPRVQFVAFAQWNTVVRQASVNARFSWEYRPLAFFTIVYNDRSPISGFSLPAAAPAASRQLLVKLGWLSQL